ncbi:MAG TPA: M56 family metallopeptidase [Anaeromyxobacteraceae bacterium]|nr:M56 family metallopeptidase [Anaeromyxobacteraceae bacterium]
MPSRTWASLAAQSTVHAVLAVLAVEALVGLWRARSPSDRLALRLAGLLQPALVTPCLWLLFPARWKEDFRFSLLALRHFDELRLGRFGLVEVGMACGAALSAALLLMDLWPLVRRGRDLAETVRAPERLVAELSRVAAERGIAPPTLRFVRSRTASLYCSGVRRPCLLVSEGALELLDPLELRSALGHELAHLKAHDPALSWALLLVRSLLWWNPVVQVVARAVARDAEWRADERAGEDRLALASAVLKLHRAGIARPQQLFVPLSYRLAAPLRRARSHDVAARCRRLLESSPVPVMAFRPARLALTVASFAVLALAVT